jgi:hypothetical protein
MASRGVARFVDSLAAIPASRSPLPESSGEKRMSDTFGLTLQSSFARYDPAGASLRMLQDTFAWDSTEFSVTLPKSGTMRSGQLSRLEMSGLPISGRDYLSWRTPDTLNYLDGKNARKEMRAQDTHAMSLHHQVHRWSTPTGDDPNNTTRASGEFKSLARDVHNWPTPRHDEYKGSGQVGDKAHKHMLDRHYLDATALEFSHQHPTTSKRGGKSSKQTRRLNPRFVEWLMGWPVGWTDFEPLGTELCRYRRLWRSVLLWILRGEETTDER